jgi:hypothetical protein
LIRAARITGIRVAGTIRNRAAESRIIRSVGSKRIRAVGSTRMSNRKYFD